MFFIKLLSQVCFALGIVFSVLTMPAYAEDLDQSVKDMYEQPESSITDETNDDSKNDSKVTEKAKVATESKVGLSIGDFMRMIFALIFVVALLYVILRFIGKKTKAYQKANFIENLGGTSLGNNRSIQLVKVGERVLIVGVGENIQLLTEINEQEERNELVAAYNQKVDQLIQPSDIISKLKSKWGNKETNMNSFTSELKTKLDDMKKSRKQLMHKLDEKGRDDE